VKFLFVTDFFKKNISSQRQGAVLSNNNFTPRHFSKFRFFGISAKLRKQNLIYKVCQNNNYLTMVLYAYLQCSPKMDFSLDYCELKSCGIYMTWLPPCPPALSWWPQTLCLSHLLITAAVKLYSDFTWRYLQRTFIDYLICKGTINSGYFWIRDPFLNGTIRNVKPTFFQERKLSFCCFCSKKDRIYSFLKQNSGSKQNVFYQY